MSDTPNNTGNDQKKMVNASNHEKEDNMDESNRTSESENEKEEKSSVTKSPKKEKEKPAKPVKKTQKKQEKTSEDETGESEEEDDEEDDEKEEQGKKVGLLDLPLEVSGSRERKKVERLEISYVVPTKEKKTDIPEGSGEKLGDCPRIEFQIQKFKTEDLKGLHRLLFNRPGTVTEIKRNIRKFSGFSFKEDSPEYERKKTVLEKMTTAALKQMCEILDLERGGTKDDIMTRIMNFLLEPKSSGKALPKGRKRSSTKMNRKKSSTDKSKTKANSNKKTKTKSSNQKNDSESENDDETAEESEKDEESSEEEKLPKKRAKKEIKKVAPKTKNNKGDTKSSKKSSEEDDSSDDEPLLKKAKQPPTDEELKTLISSILKGANLEEITMKTVCKQVYGNYPDFDLSDRKDFIKTTVRSIIS